MNFVSTVVAGVALFNLGRQYWQISLNGIVVDLIGFYQEVFFPLIELAKANTSPWMVPDWNKNLIVLVLIVVAINARSLSMRFEQVLEEDAQGSCHLGSMPIWVQVNIGLQVAFAFMAGAASIRGSGSRMGAITALTIATATFIGFVAMALLIPYVRAVFTTLLFVSMTCFAVVMVCKRETSSVKFNNNRVFANQYFGALLAALTLFALNRYAS